MQILQGERKKLPKTLNKRIWAQQNFSPSLSNITAHRQKGEIHIYIYINIKQTNKEWNKIRCLLNTNLLHWVIVDVDNLVQVACYHLKILYRKLTRSKLFDIDTVIIFLIYVLTWVTSKSFWKLYVGRPPPLVTTNLLSARDAKLQTATWEMNGKILCCLIIYKVLLRIYLGFLSEGFPHTSMPSLHFNDNISCSYKHISMCVNHHKVSMTVK